MLFRNLLKPLVDPIIRSSLFLMFLRNHFYRDANGNVLLRRMGLIRFVNEYHLISDTDDARKISYAIRAYYLVLLGAGMPLIFLLRLGLLGIPLIFLGGWIGWQALNPRLIRGLSKFNTDTAQQMSVEDMRTLFDSEGPSPEAESMDN